MQKELSHSGGLFYVLVYFLCGNRVCKKREVREENVEKKWLTAVILLFCIQFFLSIREKQCFLGNIFI
jgi:surface polysaccharide O-acyltransferase-like enzyme